MDSRQTNSNVCIGITGIAATLTLVLRIVARKITKVPIWLDDYFAILGYITALVWCVLILAWLPMGFGLHLADIDHPRPQVLERARLQVWLGELFYAFSLAFSQLAILSFYWRMFKTSNIKTPIFTLGIFVVIWLLCRTFICIFHCYPIQGYWDKSIEASCPISDAKFMFSTTLIHLILDVAILALPVIQVQKLRLPTTQKLAITAMFMFGIFVCAAAIPVLYYALAFDGNSPEIPWNISPVFIWATVEANLAVVSACLPMLRPIWTVFIKRAPLSNPSPRDAYTHTLSHSHGTQLATLSRAPKKHEDTESIYPIAGASTDGDGSIRSDSESHAYDGTKGVSTTIQAKPPSPDDEGEMNSAPLRGIVVQSEMNVKYSRQR